MKIAEIIRQHRNDFTAVMVCEHCGHTYVEHSGYDDSNYHDNVIPNFACGSCGKRRDGEPGKLNYGDRPVEAATT